MTGGEALFIFAIAAVAGVAIAYYDLKTLTIPNWLTGGLFVGFALLVFALHGMDTLVARLIGAALVLLVCFLLFWAGQMGGGDAKAATALALLVPAVDATFVLIVLAFSGLIGLGALRLVRMTPLARGEWRVWSEPRTFPYGIALAMAIIVYTGLVAYLAR